jgi:hypothetical protein
MADLVKTADGMTLALRSIGMSEEEVAESLARNDNTALSIVQPFLDRHRVKPPRPRRAESGKHGR